MHGAKWVNDRRIMAVIIYSTMQSSRFPSISVPRMIVAQVIHFSKFRGRPSIKRVSRASKNPLLPIVLGGGLLLTAVREISKKVSQSTCDFSTTYALLPTLTTETSTISDETHEPLRLIALAPAADLLPQLKNFYPSLIHNRPLNLESQLPQW